MRRGLLVLAALAVLALPGSAQAAFPGQNGKIAFWSHMYGEDDDGVFTMKPDGSDVTRLTTEAHPIFALDPVWSPDGGKIACERLGDIWTMNGDGSNQVRLTTSGGRQPTWSPDGSKIAFADGGINTMNADGSDVMLIAIEGQVNEDPTWSPDGSRIAWNVGNDIWTMAPDGTNRVNVIQGTEWRHLRPDWSPDGTKFVYDQGGPFSQIHIVDADGSDDRALTNGVEAAWSPDGRKIVFSDGGDVHTINEDGSGATLLHSPGFQPDWQPIPINAYPRPKGATPFYGSLTIAYEPCTAPDRTHGPPLAYGSCSSPQMTSDYLTVGTADANGHPPRNEGYLRLGVIPGSPGPADEADVTLQFFSDDVFTKAIDDYTGELRAKVALQITDKDNTPNPGGPGAATTTSIPLELTVGCTPVADPLEGSSCTASTSADALAPGTVKEGRRSIWQLGRVEVYDGGADGDAQTPAGDTLFARQGLFVP